jgi:hypothetical protein
MTGWSGLIPLNLFGWVLGCEEREFSGIKVGFRSLMGEVVAGWLFELTVR